MKPRKLSLIKNIVFNSVVVGEAFFRPATILDLFPGELKINAKAKSYLI